MAAFKFTFLFCALFLAFQSYAMPQTEATQAIDLLDLIKRLVKRVEGLLDRAIDIATQLVQKVTPASWEKVRGQTVDETKKVLGPILDKIMKDVTDMGAQSNPAGKKLAGCVTASRDDILAVPVGFWNDVSKCAGTNLVSTIQALAPIVKDLSGVQGDAKKIADKIDKCQGNNAQGLLCVLEVAAELLALVETIPDKVKPDYQKLVTEAKNLITTGKKCVQDQVPVYFKQCGAIFNKVAACAA